MKKIFLVIAFFTLSFSYGQVKKDLGDFYRLKVSDKIAVKLVKSSENYVEFSKDQADDLRFSNKNNQLKIRMKTTSFIEGNEAKVILHYKELDEILSSSGAKITSDETINVSMLNLRANQGSAIDLDLKLKKLKAKTNSGGEITLTGSSDVQTVSANSGGQYKGKDFKTKHSDVTVKAGGAATIFATKTVDAKTRAGGSIDIYGNADVSEHQFVGGEINIH